MVEHGAPEGDAGPGDRWSRLSEASLRINESLDLGTVLLEVLDSARALTGARFGVLTLVDEDGRFEDVLRSGVDADESRRLDEMPGGMQLYDYLVGITEPLRVPDLSTYLRQLGRPEIRLPMTVGAFLAAPLRHRGQGTGFVFLAKAAGGPEFAREDQETLVMFASQAALVIANARRHREEQQARARLETLVETSPVGVAVFDARRGVATSMNQEARRIAAELLDPADSVEQVLGSLSFRRWDDREVSLEEFSLSQALSSGETVRGEEIAIRLPDGRSVSTLVNATPIRSATDEIESYVVTMQDLTALEESERLRAEFLGMVSDELRVPLTSIRGSATTLLDQDAALDPAEARQFLHIIVDQTDRMRDMISDLLDVARIETGTLSLFPEPSDLASLVDEAKNAVVDAVGEHRLEIELPADLPKVMADRRRVVQVLVNLLSNAARYSTQEAVIGVSAERKGFQVAVSVSDRDQGIANDQQPQLFRRFSSLSDRERARDPAGSDLGLAICKGIVEAHGGRIWAESKGTDLGTRFTFTLPLSEPTSTAVGEPPSRSRRAARERTKVLAVDDDPQALRYIRDTLSRAGFAPIVTSDPDKVPRLMTEERPHLVLLDMMLPGSDGIELMQDILASTDVPIIFVSAYGKEDLVTRALDLGAVDYVVKPFSASELAARIRAALRQRAGTERAALPRTFDLGELAIDYAERRVTVAGRTLRLTATEFAVLVELSTNAGIVLTHDQLLQLVWGVDHSGDHGLVRTIVRRLRQKLGDDAANPSYIFTEPRVGYRMAKRDGPEPVHSHG